MTTQFDLNSTARFHVREACEAKPNLYRPGSTPTLYRPESTAPLARPESTAIPTGRSSECGDVTTAAAWSASPLGDPTDEDGSLSDSPDSEADQPVEDEKPRASGKWTLITAVLVGVLAGGVALALVVAGHTVWGQTKVAVVSPDASVGSVAPSVPAAASSTPAPTSEVTPAATPTVVTPTPAPAPTASSVPVPRNRGTGTPGGNQGNKGGGSTAGNQGGANPPGGSKGGLNLPCLNLPGLNQTGTPGCQPQLPGKQPPAPQRH